MRVSAVSSISWRRPVVGAGGAVCLLAALTIAGNVEGGLPLLRRALPGPGPLRAVFDAVARAAALVEEVPHRGAGAPPGPARTAPHHITSHHITHVTSCTSCTLRDDCQGREEHTDPALSSEGGGFHTGDTAAPGCHPNTMRWGGRARSGSPWCCPPVMTSPRPRPWPTPLSTCSVSEVVVVEGVKF